MLLSLNPGLVKAGADDKEKQKAWEIYKEAKQSFVEAENPEKNKKLCLDIEEKLLEAISIIPRDTKRLRYKMVEQRLVPGRGRWVEYEDVEVSYEKEYYPNQLLSVVRQKDPPRPWAVVNILENDKGKNNLLVAVKNKGSTRMDNIRVEIKTKFWRYPRTKTIPALEPGGSRQLTWEASRMRGLNIEFKEKFNYVPKKIGGF